jgi:hypothetical protein
MCAGRAFLYGETHLAGSPPANAAYRDARAARRRRVLQFPRMIGGRATWFSSCRNPAQSPQAPLPQFPSQAISHNCMTSRISIAGTARQSAGNHGLEAVALAWRLRIHPREFGRDRDRGRDPVASVAMPLAQARGSVRSARGFSIRLRGGEFLQCLTSIGGQIGGNGKPARCQRVADSACRWWARVLDTGTRPDGVPAACSFTGSPPRWAPRWSRRESPP